MNDIKIIRQDITPGRRILVTSDIHGHLNHLKRVLNKAKYCDDDLLVIVGDVIEKGPESLKTLRYVMELCERGNVIVLAGNVDNWRVQMIEGINDSNADNFYNYLLSQRKWKGTSIFDEMAAECKFDINSAANVLSSKEIITEHFKLELGFLRNRPVVLETQNYIFVHGGMPQKTLYDIESLNIYSFLKCDNFMATELFFDKYIVVGHWPVTLYDDRIPQSNPIINKDKKIISIDGGCGLKKDGQLNLIEIPNIFSDVDEIKTYSYDELPVCVAVEDQNSSADSINITWTNNEITKLECKDNFTYAEHISTGRKLWIHNDYIYKEHHCEDYTDYVLPVKKGDILSVVKKTSRGYIAKKDGVTGWYYGEVEKVR